MPTLNDKFIRSLPTPESKHKIYWDDRVIGLGIRITNNNALSFIFDYYIDNGKRKRYTIGRYPGLTTTAAREIATELKGGVVRGEDPLEDKKSAHDMPTLAELAQDYLKACEATRREKTLIEYRLMLEKHILPKLGRYKINQIGSKEISSLHLSFSDRPYRANRILELLSPIFNMAISWDLLVKNPVKGVKKFPEHKRERYLSDDEIAKIKKFLEEEENVLNIYAIKLMLLTGSRKSEVLSARWQDFDLKNNLWTKPHSMTKQKKMSCIPLSKEAMEIIKAMKKKIVPENKINQVEEWRIVSSEHLLFYNPKTKTHLKDVKRFWSNIRKKTGIKNARINDMRHTFASILVSNGIGLEVIGKLIGHSNIMTTQRYAHLANAPLKQATEMLGEKVFKNQFGS